MKIFFAKNGRNPPLEVIVDDDLYLEIIKHKWCNKGGYIGRSERFRCVTKNIKLHRWVMGVDNPKICVDHINHNKLDNRRANLRICNHSQNMQNGSDKIRGRSKYKGVSLYVYGSYQRWRANIVINGKQKSLGYYKTEEDAAAAYDIAAIKHFGKFASLNNIKIKRRTKK